MSKGQWRFIYPDYGVDPAEYPGGDPMAGHRQHNGQIVTIVRRCHSPKEFDWQGDAMFIVRADDGWEGEVWHSELHGLDYPWPNTRDKNNNPVCPPVLAEQSTFSLTVGRR